jgi:hypothetical protein
MRTLVCQFAHRREDASLDGAVDRDLRKPASVRSIAAIRSGLGAWKVSS